MAIEASIVEQLQELRRWQLQQQEELIRHQNEQREMLSHEQNRMFEALSLSVDEMSLSEQSLKDLIMQEKDKESNLIDLDTPDEECSLLETPKSKSFSQYNSLNNPIRHNQNLNIKIPIVQLAMRNSRPDSKSVSEYNNSFNQHNYSSELSVDGIQSFSSDKNETLHIPIDDLPVPSPKKDFNTLLEERLKDAEAQNVEIKNKSVIKRPFLRKGEGLARFLPSLNNKKTPKNTIRPRSASFSTGTMSTNTKSSKTTKLGRCNSLPRSKKNSVPRKSISNIPPVAQQKLTLKNVPSPRSKILPTKTSSTVPSPSTVEKKVPSKKIPKLIVSDANSSDLEIKSKKELEEVRIFELLEDKAENSSFCSTSSTVIAFLQQSTPLKHKALLHSAYKQKLSLDDIGDETFEEIIRTTASNNVPQMQLEETSMKPKDPNWDDIPIAQLKNNKTITGAILPYGTDLDLHYDRSDSHQKLNLDKNNVSLHVRFSEYNEYKTMTDNSSISSDSQTVINYMNDKAWSDCSATPDSSDIESIISLQSQVNDQYYGNNKKDTLSFLKEDHDYSDDNETINVENEEENVEDREVETDNETESKNSTLLKEDTVHNQQHDNAQLFKSELLKTRLLELEQEIEIFRKESAALTFQRQKLHEERTKLQEERVSLQRSLKEKEQSLEMEKKKMESILHEEKKRLAREKAALESRMKDAYDKAQKSKHERQEIQTLREQLEELKDEIIQKESKWSATNGRQRSQMRVIQAENSKLKQELEKLQQKKNSKLKKPVVLSNTKTIHQINKLLTDRRKISPFKKSDNLCEEDAKVLEATMVNCDAEVDNDEEKLQESQTEKVKILKTVESIARTRNLYESLLKDATDGFSGSNTDRKNFINQQPNNNVEDRSDDHSGDEDNDCYLESAINNKNALNKQKSSSSKRETIESENDDECRDDETEQQTFNSNKQGIREVHHPDGRIEFWYPNGNVKKVFPDKCLTKMIYYNGDVRETDQNGTVKYFYAATRTWHTTMPDGLEILEFRDGQVERRSKDGTFEVSFPDGSVKIVQADGSERWALRDGTVAETSADGEKILTLPNGQREIHTKDHKRREYPDGTVKLIYTDGTQETRYANGRIRLKDKDGNLLMDTHQ